MLFSQANVNGYEILKKCLNFLVQSPTALVLCLFIIVNTTTIFGGLLYAEYHYYGISIFNSETFYKLLSLHPIEHLLKILIFLAVIFICTFINNIFIVALAFYFIKKLDKQKHSLSLILKWTFFKIHHISQIALVILIDYLRIFFYTVKPQEATESMLKLLQGKKKTPNNIIHSWQGMLFLPLMVNNNDDITKNLQKSTQLMNTAFGNDSSIEISFIWIKISIIVFTIGTFGFFIHYHYNLLPALVGSFFLILIGFIIIENAVLFFNVCVYNFITKKITTPFTQKEISSYFIQEF